MLSGEKIIKLQEKQNPVREEMKQESDVRMVIKQTNKLCCYDRPVTVKDQDYILYIKAGQGRG